MKDKQGGLAVMIGMGEPKGIDFPAPEGFDYEGMKEGEEKEVLAVIRYLGDGGFCLVSIDGFSLEGGKAMPEEEMEEEEILPEEDYPSQLSARAGLA
jgi:hypothetical protein